MASNSLNLARRIHSSMGCVPVILNGKHPSISVSKFVTSTLGSISNSSFDEIRIIFDFRQITRSSDLISHYAHYSDDCTNALGFTEVFTFEFEQFDNFHISKDEINKHMEY